MIVTKVCIIGGGFSCAEIIKGLQKKLKGGVEFTLITKTDSFEFNIASVRAMVQPDMAKKIFVPYSNIFKESKGVIIYSEPLRVEQNKVILKDGNDTVIDFDYLVVCTGVKYPAPFKTSKLTKSEGIKELELFNNDLKLAKSVLIVGGGVIGCEIAGEIKTDFPDKSVSLIGAGNQLVGTFNEKLTTRVKAGLEKMKVQVVLNDRIDNLDQIVPDRIKKGWSTGKFETLSRNGKTFEADMVIDVTGNGSPNSEFLKDLNVLDEKGFVKTKSTMQIESFDNWFASGDVSNFDKFKVAVATKTHAATVVRNIIGSINGSKLLDAKKYRPVFFAVSLGRNGGSIQFLKVWGDKATSTVKSKTMLVASGWKIFNAKME
eukprot:NODE_718_length_4825_cov_0.832840.p1 type:complete len:374 gc:universal NODE_718_length_4825_cov_0.832840:4686-3565(-)